MNNNYSKEIILSLILIAFAILLINPFMFWMSTPLSMMIVAIFTAIFLAFASLVWKESSSDEREDLHKLMAGRVAFLTGSSVLVIGIILQGFMHHIDPWLVIALTAMILAKVIALTYGNRKN